MPKSIPSFSSTVDLFLPELSFYNNNEVEFAILVKKKTADSWEPYKQWETCRELVIGRLQDAWYDGSLGRKTRLLVYGPTEGKAKKALKFINELEAYLNLSSSKLFKVTGRDQKACWLFEGPYTWIRSTVLVSLYMLAIRTGARSKTSNPSWRRSFPVSIIKTIKAFRKLGLREAFPKSPLIYFGLGDQTDGISVFSAGLTMRHRRHCRSYLSFPVPWKKLEACLPKKKKKR